CGGRPRGARKAHRAARRELARLVRGVHRGGAGWDGTTDLSDYGVIVIGGARCRALHSRRWPKSDYGLPFKGGALCRSISMQSSLEPAKLVHLWRAVLLGRA